MVLSVNNLTGFNSGTAGPPITGTYRTAATPSGTTTTTVTLSAASIGTAADDRYVIACISEDNSNNTSYNSCTIGGISATLVAFEYYVANSQIVAFYAAKVTTGTTADVVVTATNTIRSTTVIGVWTIIGLLSTTPAATDAVTNGAGDNNLSLPVSTTNNVVLAVSVTATNGAFTWTNITERYDILAGISGHSGASSSGNAVGTYNFNDTHLSTATALALIYEQ